MPGPGEFPKGEAGSLFGVSRGGRGSRNCENMLFIIGMFQSGELAPYMRAAHTGISNRPVEEKKMKKLFSTFLAVAFALSMVGVVFAADDAAKAAAAAAEKKAVSAADNAAKSAAPAVDNAVKSVAPAAKPAEKK